MCDTCWRYSSVATILQPIAAVESLGRLMWLVGLRKAKARIAERALLIQFSELDNSRGAYVCSFLLVCVRATARIVHVKLHRPIVSANRICGRFASVDEKGCYARQHLCCHSTNAQHRLICNTCG